MEQKQGYESPGASVIGLEVEQCIASSLNQPGGLLGDMDKNEVYDESF